MGLLNFLFGARQPESEEARRRREESVRRLEAGGLPLNAEDRLQENAARQGTPEQFFTSNLSVNEFLLTRKLDYEALGQVMGSSIYHVGIQWRNMAWRNNTWQTGAAFEMDTMTQAFYNARHLAISRLVQEAALLGATGVIGVRLERKQYEWGLGLLEFTAIGTAIREENLPPGKQNRLFLSGLTGQEFWALKQAGYRPVHFVVGNCTYLQIPSYNTRQVTSGGIFNSGVWTNQELPDYTQSLYTARALAMSRMEAEAQSAGADGVVGVGVDIDIDTHHVENNNQTSINMIYHFTAIGTAVAESGRHSATPKLTVQLS